MKSLIVYFSQGGTTKRIAESIASGLRKNGRIVDLCNLSQKTPPSLEGYDSLGVGFPVYIYRPPFVVTDYLDTLPELAVLPVFTFMMYGTYRGDSGNRGREALKGKGGREIGYFFGRGADYFLGYLKLGYLFSPESPKKEQVEKARGFGQKTGVRLQQGESYAAERDDPPSWIYRLERFLTNRWLVKSMYSRMFRVKREECSHCGLCEKVCPMNNITMDEKREPEWGRECLFCLYCEMKCPEEAIVSPLNWPIFDLFMRYNVKQASNDKTIDHVRVIHERGRVRQVE